jgi:PhoD related phosphatase
MNSPGVLYAGLGKMFYFSVQLSERFSHFVGIDCRTERTHDKVVYDETYQKIFARLNQEMTKGHPKHLIVMLGIPIAYPRLVWLETILTSRLMVPVKLLASMGIFSGLLNKFDRGIEILDDLDDHWYVLLG